MYLVWSIIENKIFLVGGHGRFIISERGHGLKKRLGTTVLDELMYYMRACLAGGHVQLEYMWHEWTGIFRYTSLK